VLEPPTQALAIDVAPRLAQPFHVADVGGERHRRGSDVLADVQVLTGAASSQIGERVAERRGARARRAADFDELFGAKTLDERFENRVRQPHPIRNEMT
jgi:hypothetical protein